jgi:hypothetical protein
MHSKVKRAGLNLFGDRGGRAFLRFALRHEDVATPVRQFIREAAGWGSLPKGWTQESVEKFWGSLTGKAKHKVTKCIERMKDNMDDPGAFCASVADMVDPGWRSKKSARTHVALNKFNAPEVLGTLFRALEAAELTDVVDRLKQMGVPRLINDAWMSRGKTAGVFESPNEDFDRMWENLRVKIKHLPEVSEVSESESSDGRTLFFALEEPDGTNHYRVTLLMLPGKPGALLRLRSAWHNDDEILKRGVPYSNPGEAFRLVKQKIDYLSRGI